jgi:hypothetical protein
VKPLPSKQPFAAMILAAMVLACAAVPVARAQSGSADPPETWRMTVHAQPVSRPALAHALLPDPGQRTPGNAAPVYLIAMAQARQIKVPEVDAEDLKRKGLPPAEDSDLMYYYFELPIERVPVKDLEQFMRPYDPALQTLHVAARREYCRWDLPIREQGLQTPFTHLNDARHLVNLASLQARLHVARGEHAEAAREIGAVFRMGLDVAQDGMLIQSLVGTGIGAVAVERTKDLVQRPGAPNLYWPLANLPRPFVSFRSTMQWEQAGLMATFPELQRADADPMSSDDWARFVNRIPALSLGAGEYASGTPTVETTLGPAALGAVLYPRAKRFLRELGLSPEKVDAMPVPEALGRYVLGQYRARYDDMVKWSGVPYWQAIPELSKLEASFARQQQSDAPAQFFLAVIPAAARAATQLALLDRRIAMLQTVEGIRAYAAANAGKLPPKLEDMTETPAPPDPTTGKPFAYHIEGGRATLESPAPPGYQGRSGLRIELTLAK